MSEAKLNEAIRKAEVLLDGAFSLSNGPPLGYNESYHYDIRRQIIDFIQVRSKEYVFQPSFLTDHSFADHFFPASSRPIN
jgi:hypothetical protein